MLVKYLCRVSKGRNEMVLDMFEVKPNYTHKKDLKTEYQQRPQLERISLK